MKKTTYDEAIGIDVYPKTRQVNDLGLYLLTRAIPCPFRMPPAWPAGVGLAVKQKFVVT